MPHALGLHACTGVYRARSIFADAKRAAVLRDGVAAGAARLAAPWRSGVILGRTSRIARVVHANPSTQMSMLTKTTTQCSPRTLCRRTVLSCRLGPGHNFSGDDDSSQSDVSVRM